MTVEIKEVWHTGETINLDVHLCPKIQFSI